MQRHRRPGRLVLLAALCSTVGAIPTDANASIAFSSPRTGVSQIFVMEDDGSGLRQLTRNDRRTNFAAWSPDGQSIAFTMTRPDDGNEIYEMRLDDRRITQLTDNPTYDSRPRYSPDGTTLVLQSNRGFNWDLRLMGAEGEGAGARPTKLTDHPATDSGGDWSPDGTKVVFSSERDGGNKHVYTIDVHTRVVKRLTALPGFDTWAAWSPDGRSIAFTSERGGHYGLYVMDSDGRNVRVLAQAEGPKSRYDGGPSWSPDGSRIAFVSDRDDPKFLDGDIYTMDASGADVRRLTHHPDSDTTPAWSPHSLAVSPRGRQATMWGWLRALDRGRH